MKKAQGISMTTIIVAAIALLVLIVLIAIFAGRINIFSKGYDDTTDSTRNRVCLACIEEGGTCPGDTTYAQNTEGMIGCSPPRQCCVKYDNT